MLHCSNYLSYFDLFFSLYFFFVYFFVVAIDQKCPLFGREVVRF